MAGVRVHVVFSRELVERVDAVRPFGVSRGGFVRLAVERALSDAKEPSEREQAGPGSVPSPEGVRPDAEQQAANLARMREVFPADRPWMQDEQSGEVWGLPVRTDERVPPGEIRVEPGPAERSEPKSTLTSFSDIRTSGASKRGVGPVPKKGEGKR